MTVQDILTEVIRDSDNTIGTTHAALIPYVNRVHEQILRASKWRFLLSSEQSFNTTASAGVYWLGTAITVPTGAVDSTLHLTDFDRINEKYVYDRTNKRRLFRIAVEPLTVTDGYPTTFKLDDLSLSFYNTPKDVYEITFQYYKKRLVLTATSDVLQIPDDYKDVVVAGVNELVAKLQGRDNDVLYWRNQFELGKRDMRRDANAYGLDFIHPDPTAKQGGLLIYPNDDPYYTF